MMNKKHLHLLFAGFLIVTISINSVGQNSNSEPWTENQLMPPEELAAIINNTKAVKPFIFSIGPGAYIKGSVDFGQAKGKDNLKKLKEKLSKLAKNENIVIYCGCCPFEHCPNIRPAFELLNKMKFTNHKLLNLPKNIKVDWIDKGYPKNN